MTLRRLRWVLVPLLAALALAALVLPPRDLPERPGLVAAFLGLGGGLWRRKVADEHEWSVEAAHDRLRESIMARAHGAADVLAARSAGAMRSTVEPVVVLVRDRDVPAPQAQAWLRAAEAELHAVPAAAPGGVPVVVALHTRDPRSDTILPDRQYLSVYRFESDGSAGRACIVDVVLPTKGLENQGRFDVPSWARGRLLGRCVFYGRWGFPGREVGKWAGLGRRWSREWSWWYGDRPLFGRGLARRDTLYWRQPWAGAVPWGELACLRSADAYCLPLVGLGDPAVLGRSQSYFLYGLGWGYGYGAAADRLVAKLIQERGVARFAAFWSSPLPPDSALSMAYGVPAGGLAREALALRYVAAPLAQPGAGKLLVAAGWVLALGVLAMALSWRREMDA